ncbi:MAG: DUF296 domain-containing protein [Elusimicrobia bacterium]|nr:DUF296 domain-containing protein [Elusimicrobiota bacterium]
MKARRFPDGTLLLKAEEHDDVVATMTAVVNERKIFAGGFTGVGACAEAEIAFWDPKTREYLKRVIGGPLEVLALTGNVARTDDGKAFLHAHIVLGDREMNCKGGHLFRLVAEPTCEIVLRPLEGAVDRKLEACGLRLWQL